MFFFCYTGCRRRTCMAALPSRGRIGPRGYRIFFFFCCVDVTATAFYGCPDRPHLIGPRGYRNFLFFIAALGLPAEPLSGRLASVAGSGCTVTEFFLFLLRWRAGGGLVWQNVTKMILVMVWGTLIMQKRYSGQDYTVAVLVTLGGALFVLYPTASDISPSNSGRENTVWAIFLIIGYLGFDGFTSTFQDKLFKGFDVEIHNQIFYTTLCSCILSFLGCNCWSIFIPYTIRTFGALTFATIMTTRQLVSIMLSCAWFGHPLSGEQWIGAAIVFDALYTRSFLKRKPQKVTTNPVHGGDLNQSNGNP